MLTFVLFWTFLTYPLILWRFRIHSFLPAFNPHQMCQNHSTKVPIAQKIGTCKHYLHFSSLFLEIHVFCLISVIIIGPFCPPFIFYTFLPGSPVGPEDDRGEWVPESSPKMTILLISCHSRESGNPGEMKSLYSLDLRVKPEDDKSTTRCHSRFFSIVIPMKMGIQNAGAHRIIRTSLLWISGSSPKMTGFIPVVIPAKAGAEGNADRRPRTQWAGKRSA